MNNEKENPIPPVKTLRVFFHKQVVYDSTLFEKGGLYTLKPEVAREILSKFSEAELEEDLEKRLRESEKHLKVKEPEAEKERTIKRRDLRKKSRADVESERQKNEKDAKLLRRRSQKQNKVLPKRTIKKVKNK